MKRILFILAITASVYAGNLTDTLVFDTTENGGISRYIHRIEYIDGRLWSLGDEDDDSGNTAIYLPDLNITEPTSSYPVSFAAFDVSGMVTDDAPLADTPEIAEWTRTGDAGDTLAVIAEGISGDDVAFILGSDVGIASGEVLTAEGRKAAVRLDDDLPADDVYLMWPWNANGFGYPVTLNAADAWWCDNTTVAGTHFNVYGRNLKIGTGSTWLYNETTDEWLESVANNPYRATFVAPSGWSGVQAFSMHNGHGQAFGWSDSLSIEITTALGFSSDSATWYDVTDYGLVGDGTTDNRDALNTLYGTADNDTWPTIYFPTGTYLLGGDGGSTSRILMNQGNTSGVRLIGDGPDASIILGATQSSDPSIRFYQIDNVVITNMQLACTDTGYNGESYEILQANNFRLDNVKLNSEQLAEKKYMLAGQEVNGFRMSDSTWNAGEQCFFSVSSQFHFSNVIFRAMHDLGGFGFGAVSEVSMTDCDIAHYDTSDPSSGRGFGSGRWVTMNPNAGDNLYVGNNVSRDMMPRAATDSFRQQPTVVGDYVYATASTGTRTLTFPDLSEAHGSKFSLRADETTTDSIFAYDLIEMDTDANTIKIKILNWTTNSATYGDAAFTTSSWFGLRDNPNQGGGEQILREGGYATYHGHPTSVTADSITFSDISSTLTGLEDVHSVIVIAGKGQGQMRVVENQAVNRLNLTKDWRVQPDTSSIVAVGMFSRNWAVYGNSFDAAQRDENYSSTAGVQFSAGGGHTLVVDSNTFNDTVAGVYVDHPLKDVNDDGVNSWTPIYSLNVFNNTMTSNLNPFAYKVTEFEGVSDNRDESEDGYLGIVLRGNTISDPVNYVFGVNNNNTSGTDLDNMGALVIWDGNDISSATDLYSEPVLFSNEVFVGNTFTGSGSPTGFDFGSGYEPAFIGNTVSGFSPAYSGSYGSLEVPIRRFTTSDSEQTCNIYNAGTASLSWSSSLGDSGTIAAEGSDSFTFTAATATTFTVSGGGDTFTVHVTN